MARRRSAGSGCRASTPRRAGSPAIRLTVMGAASRRAAGWLTGRGPSRSGQAGGDRCRGARWNERSRSGISIRFSRAATRGIISSVARTEWPALGSPGFSVIMPTRPLAPPRPAGVPCRSREVLLTGGEPAAPPVCGSAARSRTRGGSGAVAPAVPGPGRPPGKPRAVNFLSPLGGCPPMSRPRASAAAMPSGCRRRRNRPSAGGAYAPLSGTEGGERGPRHREGDAPTAGTRRALDRGKSVTRWKYPVLPTRCAG
jgi:hypothetical protein